MSFPIKRLRRLRVSEKMRELVQEITLTPKDFICPIFVQEDLKTRIKIESMSEIERLPLQDVNEEVKTIIELGIPAIMLFGIPTQKDEAGSSAFDDNGIVQKAISQIRKEFGNEIVIMADVCLCQFTSSGHCGIIKGNKIDNDISLDTLAKIAVSQAKAGVDTVSPSAMMDGQVAAIRKALDNEGFTDVSIMSHSAKHRSNFYSPFRNAAECAPKFGDRKTYQVPFTNAREAMREVETDINEGVDIVMIKPAWSYLDLIAETRRKYNVPISAYSVSGEYALVKAASQLGYVDEKDITLEILYSIKRAGADMIVTYFAKSASKFLKES
ncbi:MAG: porphobilinogen synthase [Candidatus Nitrosopumilus limneticus]|nr:Porphobilinogen synthase [Candidatus Nitrosopumilus limneticus]MDC4212684.1 porphobilinogen synthase [Candidatus Nitrosopumilus limneticus]MDC4213063.1 porphobilinogen synthase [Candidatus Nitrosopumilus limneticus]MDC4214179.1 porphobilinogen synthase [Candidatus Nitrosopumilus limneticus]MDC4215278.1 porphobilinogen synthase [Candidatus Nitrosopumilus limneticus]